MTVYVDLPAACWGRRHMAVGRHDSSAGWFLPPGHDVPGRTANAVLTRRVRCACQYSWLGAAGRSQ